MLPGHNATFYFKLLPLVETVFSWMCFAVLWVKLNITKVFVWKACTDDKPHFECVVRGLSLEDDDEDDDCIQVASDSPIYATGIWRTEQLEGALRVIRKEFPIGILSQEDEARYESQSVISMLATKGISANQWIATVGTGSGSSQFVLYKDGEPVCHSFADGYRNHPDPACKKRAMEEICAPCPGGRPDLIVSWGAVYHACGECVNGDCKDLAPPKRAENFVSAGWIYPDIYSVPMMVIRNVAMSGGLNFKPHWDVDTPTGKYLDLGSGKVAVVDKMKYGTQEFNVPFDTKTASRGDTTEVVQVLRECLKGMSPQEKAPSAHDSCANYWHDQEMMQA